MHGKMKARRARRGHGAPSRAGDDAECLSRRPSSKSASMCPKPRSWSSNMPSVSASRNCINCAAASGAAQRKSSCLLLYKAPLGETAKARIEIMRETRGRIPHRRGGFAPARRRRCARHAAIRPARVSAGAARCPCRSLKLAHAEAQQYPRHQSEARRRARQGAARPAASLRARGGGEIAAGGVMPNDPSITPKPPQASSRPSSRPISSPAAFSSRRTAHRCCGRVSASPTANGPSRIAHAANSASAR